MKKFIGLFLIQAILCGGVFGQNTFKNLYSSFFGTISNENTSSCFSKTNDGGYIFVGTNYDDMAGSTWYGLIVKIDNKGNIEWEKKFLDPNWWTDLISVARTPDGGYIVLGGVDYEKSFVMKFDSYGNVIWSKYILDPWDYNGNLSTFGEVIEGHNGNALLALNNYLHKIDINGNIIPPSIEFNTGFWKLIDLQKSYDGGYLLAHSSPANLLKLNSSFDTVWTKTFSNFQINSIKQTIDNGILLGGTTLSSTFNNDLALIKLDSICDTLWTRSFSSAFDEGYKCTLDETIDGGIIVGSSAESLGGYFLRLNEFGDTLFTRKNETINPFLGTSFTNLFGNSVIACSDGGYVSVNNEQNLVGYESISISKFNSSGLLCGQNPVFYPMQIGFVNTIVTDGISGFTLDTISIQSLNFNLGEYPLNLDLELSQYRTVTPPICLISVDSTSTQNKVVWEKPITQAIDSFMVYREFGTGNYGIVGSVPYDSLSQFYDNTVGVNPNITSYRYKISAIDTCGNESQLSDFHETMHLSTNLAPNGNVNLIWDAYEGFPVIYYRILRDSTFSNNWEVLDSVSNNVFIWTDINPPTNGADYVIDVIAPFGCTSTKSQDHNSTRSNRANILGGGVSPGANFTANFTQINTGGTIDFLDQSINNPTSWTWQFPGGSPAFSTQQNPSGITYNTVGLYDVTIIVSNANGIDTLVKTNYIEVLAGSGGSAPACDFIASATQVPEGTPVDFLDLTLNSPTSWTWLFPGGNPAFSTDESPVDIYYNASGIYDVTLIASNGNGTDTLVKTNYIEVISTIGVQEYKEGQVRVYPNPANDRLTVELTQIELPCFFALKDMQGRTVYSTVVNSKKLEIDLSAYAKGIYLFRVNNDNFSRELKLVKE